MVTSLRQLTTSSTTTFEQVQALQYLIFDANGCNLLFTMSISKYEHLVQIEPARPATDSKPSASPVYRHISAKDAFPTLEVSTLYQLFERSVKRSSQSPCLGMRYKGADGVVGPFVFQTYGEIDGEVTNIASGVLIRQGCVGNGAGSATTPLGSRSALGECDNKLTVTHSVSVTVIKTLLTQCPDQDLGLQSC